jgi:hypothetical protein
MTSSIVRINTYCQKNLFFPVIKQISNRPQAIINISGGCCPCNWLQIRRAPTSPVQGECPARTHYKIAALAARFARQRGGAPKCSDAAAVGGQKLVKA